jgi:Flp pilus assembly secretin CpaC
MKSFAKRNYFSAFSGWIENLGVVPLLLLRAFLLLPIFVFLAFLLFLVTLVLETIFQLLNVSFFYRILVKKVSKLKLLKTKTALWVTRYPSHKIINLQKLRHSPTLVKGLLLSMSLFFTTQRILGGPHTNFQTLNNDGIPIEITLTRGEIKKLTIPGLEKYARGNGEVLSVKAQGKEGLLLKAKAIGHSDLVLWQKGRSSPLTTQVFVVRKNHQLELKQLGHSLHELGLEKKIIGEELYLEGTLKDKKSYRHFLNIYYKNPKKIVTNQLILESSLRRELYSNFLEDLAQEGLFKIPCSMEKLFIRCKVSRKLSKDLIALQRKYLIHWQDELFTLAARQYQVSLTLQQFENSQGKAFNFGLSKVEGQLGQILFHNPLSLIEENSIVLKEDQFRSQTLAHPILKGRLNSPMKVRIGQEIPFLQNVTNGVATQVWKFAGLGVDISLVPHSHRILVRYQTNLSRPDAQGISQNLQKSELLIELDKNTVLFDIGFRVKEKHRQQMPILGDIPLFGSLFAGQGHQNTYKKILCLIKVEEI